MRSRRETRRLSTLAVGLMRLAKLEVRVPRDLRILDAIAFHKLRAFSGVAPEGDSDRGNISRPWDHEARGDADILVTRSPYGSARHAAQADARPGKDERSSWMFKGLASKLAFETIILAFSVGGVGRGASLSSEVGVHLAARNSGT